MFPSAMTNEDNDCNEHVIRRIVLWAGSLRKLSKKLACYNIYLNTGWRVVIERLWEEKENVHYSKLEIGRKWTSIKGFIEGRACWNQQFSLVAEKGFRKIID